MTRPRITIKPMAANDIERIAELEQEIFTDAWPAESFDELFEDERVIKLVARRVGGDREIVAYAIGYTAADELQVYNVAVAPDFQRLGLGRRLVVALEKAGIKRGADRAVLDVRAKNVPAQELYRALGYRELSRRKRYYRSPVDDAIVMIKPLIERETP